MNWELPGLPSGNISRNYGGWAMTSSPRKKRDIGSPVHSNKLLPYEIHKKLKTQFIGKKIRYLENTPSTIWVGKQMCSEGDVGKMHGMVIIAEEQTGGIGRMGRAWVSPSGGIWITVVLKPRVPIDHIFMITMAGSIAIARAIRKEFDLGALIKWPNDIFIGNKKVAGLLLRTLSRCRLGSLLPVKHRN